MQILILRANPILQDVLQLEWLLAKVLLGLLWVLAIQLLYLSFQRSVNLYILVGTCTVLQSTPGDGHRRRVVSLATHLVDIPVGLQIRKVTYARVGTESLSILVVPQWEGIVITIGKDDGVTLFLQGHEVVLTEVTTAVTT